MIKGNTGLGVEGFFHVSASYSSNGKVFVDWEFRHKCDNGKIEKYSRWKRMTLARAKKENRSIIMCAKCKINPAISLDHHYPWMNDYNLCDGCKSK